MNYNSFENVEWMEPMSFLVEDIIDGRSPAGVAAGAKPTRALFYHGDRMEPEKFLHVLAAGEFKSRSRMYDTGLYTVRNYRQCFKNGYGPHLYELECRGLDGFFCTQFKDYKLLHPETKTNPENFMVEQLMKTGDFDRDPHAAEIMAQALREGAIQVHDEDSARKAMSHIASYSRITSIFNGILYYGARHDGDCALVWNYNCVTPTKWFYRDAYIDGTWGRGTQREMGPLNALDDRTAYGLFEPIYDNHGKLALDQAKSWRRNNPKDTFSNFLTFKYSDNFADFVFTPNSIAQFSDYANKMEDRARAGGIGIEEAVAGPAKAMFNKFLSGLKTALSTDDGLYMGKLLSGLLSTNVSITSTSKQARIKDQWLDLTKLKSRPVSCAALADFYAMVAQYFEEHTELHGRGYGNSTTEDRSIGPETVRDLRNKGIENCRIAASCAFVDFLSAKTRGQLDFAKGMFSVVVPGIAERLGMQKGSVSVRGILANGTELAGRLLGIVNGGNYKDRGSEIGRLDTLDSKAYERLFAQISKLKQSDEASDTTTTVNLPRAVLGCYLLSAFREGRRPDLKMLGFLHSAYDVFDTMSITDEASAFGGLVQDKDFRNDIDSVIMANRIFGEAMEYIMRGGDKYQVMASIRRNRADAMVRYPELQEFADYVSNVANMMARQL